MRWPRTRAGVSAHRRWFCILALALATLVYLFLVLHRSSSSSAVASSSFAVASSSFASVKKIPATEIVNSWPQNRSRDLRLYILPDTETSLLQPSWKAAGFRPYLLVIVITMPANFARRKVLRETWGSVRVAANMTTRVVFIVGIPAPGLSNAFVLQNLLKNESDRYGDVLQEDFVDSYYNLTLKSVFALKWARSLYPRVPFVLKADDDTFVRIGAVVSLLLAVEKARARAGGGPVPLPGAEDRPPLDPGPFLLGVLFCASPPFRSNNNKWYTPEYLFAEEMYPPFLSGPTYLLSDDAVHLLLYTALRTPLFPLEDVFITGICARAAGLTPRDLPGMYTYRQRLTPCMLIGAFLLTFHDLTAPQISEAWRTLQYPDPRAECSFGMC